MPLTGEELALARSSFETLKPDFQTHSVYFYEALFRHAPHLRALFREDLGGQGMKFMTTLSLILEGLDAPEALEERMREVGELHARVGVKVGDFGPMREALMDTLRKALGERFDARVEAAWRHAFDEVSSWLIGRSRIPVG